MKRRLVAGALLLSFSACTATIHRVNAPNIEGEIVGSDSDGLEVASDQGTTYRVPRESVGDIDHPGNVLALMGAAAIVLGGLVAFTSRGPEEDQKSNLVPGLLLSSTGFGLLLGGMVPYSESRRASRTFAEARPPRLTLPAEGGWTAGPPPPLPAPPLLALPPPAPEPQPPLFSDGLLAPPTPPPSDDLVAPPDEPPPSPATIVPASDSSPSRSGPAPAPFEKKKRPPVLFKPAPPAAPLPPAGG